MGKKTAAVIFLLFLALQAAACGNTYEPEPWPQTGLAALIPGPQEKPYFIFFNTPDLFQAAFEIETGDAFSDYVSACREMGFTVEAEESADRYTAFNEDGYRVEAITVASLKKMSVSVEPPVAMDQIVWPKDGLASLLPDEAFSLGTIITDKSYAFSAVVGNVSDEAAAAYVEECIRAGFDSVSIQEEKRFCAADSAGHVLEVEYLGLDRMKITVFVKE